MSENEIKACPWHKPVLGMWPMVESIGSSSYIRCPWCGYRSTICDTEQAAIDRHNAMATLVEAAGELVTVVASMKSYEFASATEKENIVGAYSRTEAALRGVKGKSKRRR